MELQVELIKPKAQKFSRELKQVIDVDVKQYTILVNGKSVGYVCEANGLPINWLPIANAYQPEVLAKLEEAINADLIKRHGEKAGGRPANAPLDQESVEQAIEIAAKMADRENSIDEPSDEEHL